MLAGWIIAFASGAALAFALGWALASARATRGREREAEESRRRLQDAESRLAAFSARETELRAQLDRLSQELSNLRERWKEESEARIRAETHLKESLTRLDEERRLLQEAQARLSDAFKALAGETLTATTNEFLKLARASLETILADARGDINQKQAAIDALVKPIAESLSKVEENLRGLEKARIEAYSGLKEQVAQLASAHQQLQRETANLVHALKAPQTRGRWAEITLRRIAELAGMIDHVDFEEQVSVIRGEERQRPDMVVRLPNERIVVIDAKVSLTGYLAAVDAKSEEERDRALDEHATQIKAHIDGLASRRYWESFNNTPDFVVMFVPGDAFLSAAVMKNTGLIEYAMERKVVIATPSTLLALLKAVAFGWRQARIEKHAQRISDLGKELYERLINFSEHMRGIAGGLQKAVESYNKAVGSFEQRLMPSARRFKEFGATGSRELEDIEEITSTPRTLNLPEASIVAQPPPPGS